MEFVWGIVILMLMVVTIKKNTTRRLNSLISQIGHSISTGFLIGPCPRCNENQMSLITVSPSGKSISYDCDHCKKKMRAAAASKKAEILIVKEWESLRSLIIKNQKKFVSNGKINVSIPFEAPEAVMPYEQTTREPISERVRSEVWRRDGGKCVACDSKQNLQFDHIIPMAKGGATTAANLQILCRACNLKKSSKI